MSVKYWKFQLSVTWLIIISVCDIFVKRFFLEFSVPWQLPAVNTDHTGTKYLFCRTIVIRENYFLAKCLMININKVYDSVIEIYNETIYSRKIIEHTVAKLTANNNMHFLLQRCNTPPADSPLAMSLSPNYTTQPSEDTLGFKYYHVRCGGRAGGNTYVYVINVTWFFFLSILLIKVVPLTMHQVMELIHGTCKLYKTNIYIYNEYLLGCFSWCTRLPLLNKYN